MRVVHLSTQHRPLDVRIYQKECRTLAARGFDTHLVVADPPVEELQGVRFHRFDKPSTWFRPGRVWQRLARMYEAAANLHGDVYHFHDPELITVGWMLKQRGARVIYDVHEDAPQEALTLNKGRAFEARMKSGAWSLLEQVAKRSFDAFVCATPYIAGKFPRPRTVTVQNYPMLAEFAESMASDAVLHRDRPACFLYAGGITAIRGVREMVRAFGMLPADDASRFALLGEFGPKELRDEVERLPGWERVDYAGLVSREEMQRHMRQARAGLVLFHPEKDHLDAFPNKMFEYMAAGLPVIASDFPLWRRIVGELGCGVVVDPLDPRAIASAMQRLLADPAEAEAMGRRGRDAVATRFNWETESRKLLNLYADLQRAA
jgi:glycosyltransferase involved in cell wall biosynthesis